MLPDPEIINNRIHMDRLVDRRDRIMTRIRTIDDQLRQLERNALLHDQKGEPQQRNLLIYLSNFHHTEVDQVDSALNRMAVGKYGVCIACRARLKRIGWNRFRKPNFALRATGYGNVRRWHNFLAKKIGVQPSCRFNG